MVTWYNLRANWLSLVMRALGIALLCAAGVLSSCSSWSERRPAKLNLEDKSPADRLVVAMIGLWKTAPDDPENHFTDQRFGLEPLGEGDWVYYQLNTGPEQKIYRQRIIQLLNGADGQVVQITYSLKEPELFGQAQSRESAFDKVSFIDLEPTLTKGCEMIWREDKELEGGTWVGIVDPDSCKIYSERRQAEIGIYGESRLNDETLRQTEKGFDADGKQLFGSKDGSFILLYRQ